MLAEENDGRDRYRLLETVRQYARERLLGKRRGNALARGGICDYFLGLAEEAESAADGGGAGVWLAPSGGEHDNLRSALAWSSPTGGDAMAGLRLAGAIWWFWYVRGYLGEGRGWLSRMLLATPPGEPTAAARAKALDGAGILARQQSDYAARKRAHE